MGKYIIKESELRSVIRKVVAEELNEGLGHALGSALKNTAKSAALGVVAPSILAQKAFGKANSIINGPDTITSTVKDFFGAGSGSNDKKATKREKQMKSLEDEEHVGRKYGRPNTTSKVLGRGDKLQGKVPFNTQEFGRLGRHYEDIDGVWDARLERAENDLQAHPNLRRRLAKQLKYWLDERDKTYESLVKNY